MQFYKFEGIEKGKTVQPRLWGCTVSLPKKHPYRALANLHCFLFARSDARCVYRQKIFRALPGAIFFYSESDIKAAWLL